MKTMLTFYDVGWALPDKKKVGTDSKNIGGCKRRTRWIAVSLNILYVERHIWKITTYCALKKRKI